MMLRYARVRTPRRNLRFEMPPDRKPHALVELDRVDVEIAGATVLHDITWRLEPGVSWGVVGANGSGKSTFLALVAGTRWPAPGRGSRRYDFGTGPETDALTARRAIATVGPELQDRYVRLGWNFTSLDVVLSGLFRTDVPRKRPTPGENVRARSILRDLGLAALAERPFLDLSRGEQRRVLIARAVAFGARVLLLDEPASGLDAAARVELDAVLERVGSRAQWIATAHAVADLPKRAAQVLELDAGRIVRAGPRAELEHRHLAPRALAQTQGHHGRADACADVYRALRAQRARAAAVQPVHVLVSDKLPEEELVHARERHLACVRVPREHQRHAALPEVIRLFRDVRQADRR
ncbi:MAG TPA: ATP-binding cassette domain-containing protein [Gammaproteobacteria bacterium]|nr:ATP-binding cassette domain-containing protein [Gammaproteobacteria bacterium]